MATITSNPTINRPMATTNTHRRGLAVANPIAAGVLTGQVAGLITALAFMILFGVFMGMNPFYPIQVIGSFVLGPAALEGFNFAAIITGVLIHQLVIALVMGLLFGVLARALDIRTTGKALMVGLGLGVVSMVGPYFIYPAIMNGLHGADLWNLNIPMSFSWITYLIMGASFAFYPKIAEKLSYRSDMR